MTDPVFKLFANCIPVKGARRSLLCDLQNGRLKLIPNSLQELLTVHKDRSVQEIKSAHKHRYDREIDEYFAFLIEGGWGFWCDDPESFPDLNLDYEIPELISNAVIDSDATSQHDYVALMDQLEDLGCKHIQFRFFEDFALQKLETIVAATEGRRLRGIEIYVPFGPGYEDADQLSQWCRRFPRIVHLVVTAAPAYRVIHTADPIQSMGVLIYHPDVVDGPHCCGVIDKAYFVVNITSFTEAMNFNSCLNRKISVDTRGFIKNCPTLEISYGQTSQTTLKQALHSKGFQDVWTVTKDQVAVCQDCEFRYVCTDCRAVTEDQQPLGKPARCGYDPYTATWGKAPVVPFPV